MAKQTLTQRVSSLEEWLECIDTKLLKLDYDVNNGMSERIAAALVKHQQEQWQIERDRRLKEAEDQLAKNREYGEKRDAEQATQMKRMEIKTKLWSAIVPAGITAIGIVVVTLLTRGGP